MKAYYLIILEPSDGTARVSKGVAIEGTLEQAQEAAKASVPGASLVASNYIGGIDIEV